MQAIHPLKKKKKKGKKSRCKSSSRTFSSSITMKSLVRDSIFGIAVRIVTGARVFKYEEEKQPELWERYVNKEKSAAMARYGRPDVSDDVGEHSSPDTYSPHSNNGVSSGPRDEESQLEPAQEMTGEKVDQETGKNVLMIDWVDEKDPEVS